MRSGYLDPVAETISFPRGFGPGPYDSLSISRSNSPLLRGFLFRGLRPVRSHSALGGAVLGRAAIGHEPMATVTASNVLIFDLGLGIAGIPYGVLASLGTIKSTRIA